MILVDGWVVVLVWGPDGLVSPCATFRIDRILRRGVLDALKGKNSAATSANIGGNTDVFLARFY